MVPQSMLNLSFSWQLCAYFYETGWVDTIPLYGVVRLWSITSRLLKTKLHLTHLQNPLRNRLKELHACTKQRLGSKFKVVCLNVITTVSRAQYDADKDFFSEKKFSIIIYKHMRHVLLNIISLNSQVSFSCCNWLCSIFIYFIFYNLTGLFFIADWPEGCGPFMKYTIYNFLTNLLIHPRYTGHKA